MTLIIGFLFLAIPLSDLFTQPISPFIHALPCSCGNGDYLNVGVEFGYIALAGFEVKIEVRHNIYLIYEQHIAY